MRTLALLLGVSLPAVLFSRPDDPLPARELGGIIILDNCDTEYEGKSEYKDNLTFLNSEGEQTFRKTGFNNCETGASSRMVAPDSDRRCLWVIENVTHCIRRFDLKGNETLSIKGVQGSAIAVDPESGNIWVLVVPERIHEGRTVVYDTKGNEVASYKISGSDIVYDRHSKSFWIADINLTKISAARGEVLFQVPIPRWGATSLDVDQETGCAWVAVAERSFKYQLRKFDSKGKPLAAIELGQQKPFRVSVDSKTGCAWVAILRKSVERYSRDGQFEARFPIDALTVQADSVAGAAWVVTSTDVQKINSKGQVVRRLNHVGKTSQAWIASIE